MKQNNKQNNKQILLIFLVFSVIISLSHILIKDIFHSVSSEEVLLKNAKNLSLKKEEQLKIFLKNYIVMKHKKVVNRIYFFE